jgi:hypothetical protein
MEKCFEQATVFGFGSSELRFQPIAQRHQFIHLGHDAVLFSKGGMATGKRFNFAALISLAVCPVAVLSRIFWSGWDRICNTTNSGSKPPYKRKLITRWATPNFSRIRTAAALP